MRDYACYLVTCLDDRDTEAKHSTRVLATRQTFPDRKAAKAYARTIAKGRRAQVLPCIFPVQIVRSK